MHGRRTLTAPLIAPLTALALALGTGAVVAQDVMPLSDWNEQTGALADGWSAEQVIKIKVRNENGEEIGEVENIVIGPDDDVKGLILEVGGFLDIGDTHLMVPWDDIDVTGGSGKIDHVTVPVSDDNWDQFSLEPESGDVEAAARSFRATELIGDYTHLEGNEAYGIVSDLIFDVEGMLEAVVVNQSGAYGGGYMAYPYQGYDNGFDPGAYSYDLPYTDDDISELEPFDYDGIYGGD